MAPLGGGRRVPPRARWATRRRTSRSRCRRPTSPASCTWATRSTPRSRTSARASRACAAGNTKWIYGTDHAGIATQVKVEQQLVEEGTSREALGREAFIERVWEWREQYGSRITEQFRRLGASLDYDDERFTMDEQYAQAVAHVFVRALREGPRLPRQLHGQLGSRAPRSAISDLEVEQRWVEDTLYSIDYPLESGAGSVTVATVRPETMLADTAIAVNPDDERYTRLVGEAAILPIVGRRLPIIADQHVDPEFGTGALKITPGHDPNDFEIGRKHGLDEVSVIGEDGLMTDGGRRALRRPDRGGRPRARWSRRCARTTASRARGPTSTTCPTRTARAGGSSR